MPSTSRTTKLRPKKQPRTVCVYEQIHYTYPCPRWVKTEKQATAWFLNLTSVERDHFSTRIEVDHRAVEIV